MEENQRVLEALQRLAASLATLNDRPSLDLALSHWRELTDDVSTAYRYISDGAELVKATSTKYTLVGKIDEEEGSKLAKDLLSGTELVAAGTLVLCNDDMGCARSTRRYAKQATRSLLGTTLSLVSLFTNHESAIGEQVAAQKTGAVWASCDQIAKLPKGNRTSMRRDLLLWTRDCNETLQEFTDLLAIGPTLPDEMNHHMDETWDDFCEGHYTNREFPAAHASVALVKCSRGSMNVAINACERAGDALRQTKGGSDARKGLLLWISTVHNLARAVGEGMTDLGALLYPPLELRSLDDEGDHLARRVGAQRDSIVALHEFVLDTSPHDIDSFDLSDILRVSTRLRAAAMARCDEAQSAIATAIRRK